MATSRTCSAHAAEVKNKRQREGLLNHADDARQSRTLAQIHVDCPVEFDAEAMRYRGSSRERCFDLFTRLGFRTLVMDFAPTAQTVGKDYQAVDTIDGVTALAAELRAAGRFALRVLPDQPSAMRASIVGLSFSTAPRQARYVPFAGSGTGIRRAASTRREALAVLRPVLEDPAIKKVGHDLKFDAILLARHGVAMQGLETDTMIASYLVDANRSSHPLEDLALEHTGYKALTRRGRLRPRREVAFVLPDSGRRRRSTTAASDRIWRCSSRRRCARSWIVKRSTPVYEQLEHPLIPVLMAIERAGIRIDATALASQAQHVDEELYTRARRIYELSGEEFNINSPKKLGEILFDKMGLTTETLKRTSKTKAHSTAFEVLEELGQEHELPRLVLEWRGLMKLKGTYIDALPQLVNPETGRVHTCFNQAVAATGRLSSSDPNLQNIPIRTELGREIRRAFVAERGHVLISADYSQIELRVLAHLSGDPALLEAFTQNIDIHDRTALEGVRRRQRAERARAAAACQDHQLRAALRQAGLHAGEGHRRLARGSAGVHRRLLRRVPVGPRLHRRPAGGSAADRYREDDVRPPAAGARPQQPERPGARRRRARRGQHADPGIGRRHPEEGDDRRPRRAAVRRPAAAPA